MEKEQNTIKKIKEYLPLIILIPTVIGGTIQVLQLTLMSTSFVRFFSVTQSINDGIFSLFFVVVISLIVIIIFFFRVPYLNFKNKTLNRITIGWIKDIIRFCIDVFVYTCIFFSVFFGVCFFIRSDFSIIEVFYVLFFLSFIIAILMVIILNRKKKKELTTNELPKKEKNYDHIKWYHLVIYYSLFFILILFTINFANSRFDGIQNKEYIYCYLDTKEFEYDIEEYEIRYFNDKYIFVELYFDEESLKSKAIHGEEQKKSIITVLEFDVFFDVDACKEVESKI